MAKQTSEIYQNAVDSLRIGMEFFLREKNYSSRKHAILTLFHSLELFLKEYLHQINPILIYKNIDSKITEDSVTVGIKDILARLENLDTGLPEEQKAIIEKIQRRRNRIEHHRYDHKDEDELVIAETLKFIIFFVDYGLERKLEKDIDPETLREIQRLVFKRDELRQVATSRLERWMHEKWPKWDPHKEDTPEEFHGTVDCPLCRETSLVIGYHKKPFCFSCNTSVDAAECENCGNTFLVKDGCTSCRDYS